MRRRFLRAVACGVAGVLLLAQLAVAAYACPQLSGISSTSEISVAGLAASADGATDAPGAAEMDQMAGCTGMAVTMDPTSPNLCAEHCRYGQQSDQVPSLNVPVALLVALYARPLVLEVAAPPSVAAVRTTAPVAASPPHAILHCVYRI